MCLWGLKGKLRARVLHILSIFFAHYFEFENTPGGCHISRPFHIYSVHGTVIREPIWTTKQNWGTHTVEHLHWIVRVYVFGILIRTGSWSLTWSWSVLDSNTDWILIRIGSGSGFSRVRRDVYQEGHKGRPQKNVRKIHLLKSWKPGEVSCNWDFF